MADECRICGAQTVKVSGNGLAQAKACPAPAFDGHRVVGTTAHKDLVDVTADEWQAIGELVGELTRQAGDGPGFEKMYLLAIGDSDKGHFHMHLVPKRTDDPGLGQFIFGSEGWNAKRS